MRRPQSKAALRRKSAAPTRAGSAPVSTPPGKRSTFRGPSPRTRKADGPRVREDTRSRVEPTVCRAAAESTANRATIVAFSGDMDKLFAAFVIATGAAAAGMEVSMFFTFWGLAALKKKRTFKGKGLSEVLMALMLPAGPASLTTSRMNFLGAGPAFFRQIMRKKNVQSLPDLIALARQSGVRLIACTTSMDVMGIAKEELIEGLDFGGVTTYLTDAMNSKITLFI